MSTFTSVQIKMLNKCCNGATYKDIMQEMYNLWTIYKHGIFTLLRISLYSYPVHNIHKMLFWKNLNDVVFLYPIWLEPPNHLL